jgi:serine/threonine protein kinase
MENLSGGDLFTYLERRSFCVSEDRARELSHQIATSLFYLHSFGVAHRDLKPENILMASDDDNCDCKIVDFGLSKIIGPNQTSLDPFGTLSYVAPEVLLQKPYGKEVDVWSLGVITYLLLSCVLPFDDEDEKEIARQTIQDDVDFSFSPWDEKSKQAIDACRQMLMKNRHKRPSVEEVMNLPWFAQFKKLNERGQKDAAGAFKAYALTTPDSPTMQKEIDLV